MAGYEKVIRPSSWSPDNYERNSKKLKNIENLHHKQTDVDNN